MEEKSAIEKIKDILALLPWRVIGLKVWEAVEPSIQEKVNDTESKWDNVAYDALKVLVEKFLK